LFVCSYFFFCLSLDQLVSQFINGFVEYIVFSYVAIIMEKIFLLLSNIQSLHF
jgi:hypothetical protein